MAVTMTKKMAAATAIAAMTVLGLRRKGSQVDPALLPIATQPVRQEPRRSAPVNRDMADILTGTAMA